MVLSHIDIQTRMYAVNFENVGKPQMSERIPQTYNLSVAYAWCRLLCASVRFVCEFLKLMLLNSLGVLYVYGAHTLHAQFT